MDNYLSHRWPADMIPPPPPKQKKKKRRSRRGRTVLLVLLALILLAGLAVGSFFGVEWLAGRMAEEWDNKPVHSDPLPSSSPHTTPEARPTLPPSSLPDGAEWSYTDLPQGAPDPDGALELHSDRTVPTLDATELYAKLLPSMVCVQSFDGLGYHVGSGIIFTGDGYIITNYHVIQGGLTLEVMTLSDQKIYSASLVGFDEELDLAILKASGSFVPAELGDSDALQVGETVYAIGNPLGYLLGTMTDGIVSAKDKNRVAEFDYPGRLIQTTAALNSGNSGGALVDCWGRVVGITSAKITGIREDVVIEGLGLAIPISDAKPYLDRILRTGKTARPSIGIMCYATELGEKTGIYVDSVTESSPAWGKLLPDDFILYANGIPALSIDDMTRVFAAMEPGDQVELTVLRKGKEITVLVELYDRLTAE